MKRTDAKNIFIQKKYKGFTLVELIIVITILIILGTIAFTSISGFSGGARDSSRISDMNNISKALELSYIQTNSYPNPDGYFTVTYSGGSVWTQWTIGDTVMTTLNAAWGMKLSKKPTDPLTTANPYTYSKLSYGKAFQIKADWEGDSVALSPIIPGAQASTGNPTIAYIKGNYNGISAKTQTGNIIYLLAVPSIVTSTGVTYLSSIDMWAPTNYLSGTLFVHGGSNKTGISFNPKAVYSSGALPTTAAEQILFASWVAAAYSGTSIAINAQIKPFIVAMSSNNTDALVTLGGGLLSASLGGSPAKVPAVIVPQYLWCTSPDILVGWKYWAACNVGATTVSASYSTGADDSPLTEPESKRGKYFQWGENIAWDYDGGVLTTDNCTWNRDTQSCTAPSLSAWPSTVTDAVSGGVNRWNDWSTTDNRGPCALDYHVPTLSEWDAAYIALGSNRNTFVRTLRLPMAGSRSNLDGSIDFLGVIGIEGSYWSSSPSAALAYFLYFDSSFVGPATTSPRAYGFSVRCIKN